MADVEKGGWLGKAIAAVKAEITDEPQAPKPVKPKAPTSVAPPEYTPPSSYVPPPINSGIAPAGGYAPPAPPAGGFVAAITAAGAPPVDKETLDLINNSVFPPDQPSPYTTFVRVWDAMQRTPDANMVLNALKAAVPDASPEKIVASIKAHKKLLDKTAKTADADLESAAQQLLGGADQKIAELLNANAAAQAEIEKRQKEIADNLATIAATQQERIGNNQKIVSAKTRTDAAVAFVAADLTRGEAFVSPLIVPKAPA